MPIPGSRPLDLPRQEKFALAIAQGLPDTEALAAAGYSDRCNSASGRLKRNTKVAARISHLRHQAAEKVVNATAVERSEIIESLRDTRKRAKRGTPLMAKDGTPTGVSKPDLSAANRSDEILAKMHGFMLDVHKNGDAELDAELEGMSAEDIQEFIHSLLEQIDPNLRKTVMGLAMDYVEATREDVEPGDAVPDRETTH